MVDISLPDGVTRGEFDNVAKNLLWRYNTCLGKSFSYSRLMLIADGNRFYYQHIVLYYEHQEQTLWAMRLLLHGSLDELKKWEQFHT